MNPEVLDEIREYKEKVFKKHRRSDIKWLELEWAKISNNLGVSVK